MAPEQVRGEDVDGRTDLYAVGVVFYRLLTGKLPFDGGDWMDVLTKQSSGTPPVPSTRWPSRRRRRPAAVAAAADR